MKRYPAVHRDEIWTTLDGRKVTVGDMGTGHVRNALGHVIFHSRYARLLREMLFMQDLSDAGLDLYQMQSEALEMMRLPR